MTAALEGGEWSAASPGPTLSPGKDLVPILQEAGWAPGPVWTGGKFLPHLDSIPDHPACSSVAIPTELPDPLSHIWYYYYYYYYLSGKEQLSPAFVRKIFHLDKYPET